MQPIVVQYFYDLTELSLAQRYLEKAGIATLTRDANSTQTFSLEARAIGGAKLLVDKRDYLRASKLLIEGGFMNANANPAPFGLTEGLDNLALILPGAGRLSRELRLVVIGFLVLALLLSMAFLWLLS
jgi:hypothetical protein